MDLSVVLVSQYNHTLCNIIYKIISQRHQTCLILYYAYVEILIMQSAYTGRIYTQNFLKSNVEKKFGQEFPPLSAAQQLFSAPTLA